MSAHTHGHAHDRGPRPSHHPNRQHRSPRHAHQAIQGGSPTSDIERQRTVMLRNRANVDTGILWVAHIGITGNKMADKEAISQSIGGRHTTDHHGGRHTANFQGNKEVLPTHVQKGLRPRRAQQLEQTGAQCLHMDADQQGRQPTMQL